MVNTTYMSPSEAEPLSVAPVTSTLRDPRLDFYRGIAMFIILIAHTPGNFITLWIPARFGFSDATEIFVFCSGMASAIAFGRVFRERSWFLGTARVAFRVWQVYWAHIGLFFAIAAAMALLNATGAFERDYVGQLNLYPFFNNAQQNLIGLLSLSYVPNYFDILPMYLAILAMMPFMVLAARVHPWLVAVLVAVLWVGAQAQWLQFPAEPWSDREWFFNPFGWQLVFFTGFAFMIGWLPAPRRDYRLLALAIGVVLLTIPFAYFRVYNEFAEIRALRSEFRFLFAKTDFGILRYIHFLSLAYIGWYVAGVKGRNLLPESNGPLAQAWRFLLAQILKVGQQSLAVFLVSMFLARMIGVMFDVLGRSVAVVWAGNIGGMIILVLAAYVAGWFKSAPWRKPRGAAS